LPQGIFGTLALGDVFTGDQDNQLVPRPSHRLGVFTDPERRTVAADLADLPAVRLAGIVRADGNVSLNECAVFLEKDIQHGLPDQLADRVSVVDRGRIVADGTPDELKARAGGDRIDVVLRDAGQLGAAVALLPVPAEGVSVDPDRRLLSAQVTDRMAALSGVVRALEAAGIEAEDIALRRPTLDEVFLDLTGGDERTKEAA
jgi:hypothetical protein